MSEQPDNTARTALGNTIELNRQLISRITELEQQLADAMETISLLNTQCGEKDIECIMLQQQLAEAKRQVEVWKELYLESEDKHEEVS